MILKILDLNVIDVVEEYVIKKAAYNPYTWLIGFSVDPKVLAKCVEVQAKGIGSYKLVSPAAVVQCKNFCTVIENTKVNCWNP